MSLAFDMHALQAQRPRIPGDCADCDERMLDLLAADADRTRAWLRDHCTAAEFATIIPHAGALFRRLPDAELVSELIRTADRLCDRRDRARLRASLEDELGRYASERRADRGTPGAFDAAKVRAIIAQRAATNDEACWLVEECWKELAAALACDLDGAGRFLLTECTDDELSWISEAMDDLIWMTQSADLVTAYRIAIRMHPKEARRYRLDDCLDSDIATRLIDRDEARRLIAWRPENAGIPPEAKPLMG